MTRGRRLTFLGIAVVIAVVAVIVLAGGGDETGSGANSVQTPTPTPTATATGGEETPTPTATPKPPPLLQAGKERTLTFKQGETVRFRVRNDTAEEVHVHGYDIKKELQPGKTATVSFKATITGIFEIELEASHAALAQLKVEP